MPDLALKVRQGRRRAPATAAGASPLRGRGPSLADNFDRTAIGHGGASIFSAVFFIICVADFIVEKVFAARHAV